MGIIRRLKNIFFVNQSNFKIGEARLQGNSYKNESEIGDYTYVSTNTIIKHTVIGKFCSIASNCVIGESDHPYKFLSTSPIFYHNGNIFGEIWTEKDHIQLYNKTEIGNDVWIGSGVFIKSGVKIGNGAVIAAGAIVVKDVPDYHIVGGVPAKLIKKRFSDKLIALLMKKQWWNWELDKLKKCQNKFVINDEDVLIEFLENEG